MDEQQIMERTGHRSVTGVRAYKRTSDYHLENCSAILDGKLLRSQEQTANGEKEIFRARPHLTVNIFINNSHVTINNSENQ